MEASTSIDALNPKRSHIALLVSAISVRILQRLLDPFSGDPDAILGAAPETLGKFKDLLFVHHRGVFFLASSADFDYCVLLLMEELRA
jgi:hypothetical protein